MSQDTNEVETTCSYCGMPINPGRGIHGIGRLANSWLHKSICKDVTDRSESKYLRSHNIDTDQENGHKSRRSSSPPPMSLIQAQDLLGRIHHESCLKADIHQLGDGSEYVIVLNDYFYIWSSEDWNQIPEESTDEASTDTESKVPELVY